MHKYFQQYMNFNNNELNLLVTKKRRFKKNETVKICQDEWNLRCGFMLKWRLALWDTVRVRGGRVNHSYFLFVPSPVYIACVFQLSFVVHCFMLRFICSVDYLVLSLIWSTPLNLLLHLDPLSFFRRLFVTERTTHMDPAVGWHPAFSCSVRAHTPLRTTPRTFF